MKALFVWPGITGYMGGCWRALAARAGVELKVAVDLEDKYFSGRLDAGEAMAGVDWSDRLPADWKPDIVFSVGWSSRLCREAALRDWNGAKKICCFDMPWAWNIRKVAARWVLGPYLRRFQAAFVNGKSAARYAKWLRFDRVYEGLVGTDLARFGAHEGGEGFLFLGREAPEKRLDVLRAAHAQYRARGGRWGLKIVSSVKPEEVAAFYRRADAFVLASEEESWGVVLVEAAAAGLPIICTDKCGARHEVVQGNGLVVKAADVRALADAMARMERLEAAERRAMGEKGRLLAAPYGCDAWADRVELICKKELE